MSDFIDNLRKQINGLRVELAELETAQRVYFRMNGAGGKRRRVAHGAGKRSKKAEKANENGSFSNLTVMQAAQCVLKDAKEPLHSREIFQRAVDGGYSSGRNNGNGNPSSFEVTMRRNKAVFKAEAGKFSLKGENRG